MTADGLKKKLLPMSETMFYILSFTRQVSVYVPQVVLSVVDKDMSQKEIAECERLARQTGALFRIRAYIED